MGRIALLAGLLAASVVVPCAVAIHVALDTAELEEQLRDSEAEALYQATHAYVKERLDQYPELRKLEGTPLALAPAHIRELVDRRLEREQLRTLALSLHRDVVERVQAGGDATVVLELTELRREIVRGLGETLKQRLSELPDCSAGDDVEGAWTAVEGALTGEPGSDILSELPDCKPVGPLRERIESSLGQRVEQAADAEERIVLLGPGQSTPVVAAAHWGYRLFAGWSLLAWAGALVFLLGVYAWRRGASRATVAAGLAEGLGFLAVVYAGVALAVHLGAGEALAATVDGREAELFGPPIVEQLAAPVAFYLAIAAGAALALAGLLAAAVRALR